LHLVSESCIDITELDKSDAGDVPEVEGT